jgi:3-oxoacyl-[acyl-carrier-protein] synthase II
MDGRVTGDAAVVVTGIGVLAGPDGGAEALAATLAGPSAKTSAVDDARGYHRAGSPRRAILVGGTDLSPWLPPAAARRMSLPSRYAVVASRMAIAQAGLAGAMAGASTGVVMASAFGPVTCTEEMLATARTQGPQAVSPFAFAESVANAPAGQMAIAMSAQGPNITLIQREAGALTAVARGVELVRSGRADRVLAGVVDEVPPILHGLLGRFAAMARPEPAGTEIARPFDVDRNGFLAAEGAAVLVLERAGDARARGARILARIRACGGGFDPSAPRIGWGTGHAGLANAIRRTMTVSGCAPRDVTRVVCGASGSVAGDREEAGVLRDLWAEAPMPTVLAPKGHVGQYGGGFLAAAFLAAGGGTFGPTAGFRRADPGLGLMPFAGGDLDPSPLTLVTTVGSGGSAALLLVEQP